MKDERPNEEKMEEIKMNEIINNSKLTERDKYLIKSMMFKYSSIVLHKKKKSTYPVELFAFDIDSSYTIDFFVEITDIKEVFESDEIIKENIRYFDFNLDDQNITVIVKSPSSRKHTITITDSRFTEYCDVNFDDEFIFRIEKTSRIICQMIEEIIKYESSLNYFISSGGKKNER